MKIINRIKQSKCKYILIILIVMLSVFAIGTLSIMHMSNIFHDQSINYTEFTVANKYVDNNGHHNYIIVNDKNESYDLPPDSFGRDIFNDIEVGHHYQFVTQKDDKSVVTHIIQVHNDSS